ncbi:aspartate/glutamate racemase family protein [Alteromonas lipolytica]|uniref:Aspartate/glutamate racemase n=1 Tax=Alteromonas lipolytica TaxID=1856405 RepID=A0A1E8FD12_9ALTE|nr:aspartate/glutamate racemase family protein [Alteromonas lipolytica]OFI33825.1 aspartate/glutamate racemase [Alteromonas lipolytica]GGF68050.1 racemase [Alteromonas lipolytica]
MKTVGLIGGMSWESSVLYYQQINRLVLQHKGGLHSAPLILHSVDFAEIARLQHADDWEQLGNYLADIAKGLEAAGASALAICTNTMHKVAPQIAKVVRIPLLHIGDAVLNACKKEGFLRVGLLGTQFTMEQPFLKDHLAQGGLEVLVPSPAERQEVHRVIYEELCRGIITDDSLQRYLAIIDNLRQQGAEAVVLGCTEIGLLVNADQSPLPVLDTTALHAQSVAAFMLAE